MVGTPGELSRSFIKFFQRYYLFAVNMFCLEVIAQPCFQNSECYLVCTQLVLVINDLMFGCGTNKTDPNRCKRLQKIVGKFSNTPMSTASYFLCTCLSLVTVGPFMRFPYHNMDDENFFRKIIMCINMGVYVGIILYQGCVLHFWL